jgi:hypothetical protein
MFPHINLERDVTFEETNPTFRNVVGNPKTQIETWFLVPYEEFTETHPINRAYAKFLGKLPTTIEILGVDLAT